MAASAAQEAELNAGFCVGLLGAVLSMLCLVRPILWQSTL